MTKTSPIHPSDVLGYSRLAVEATAALAAVVESMHLNIARKPPILAPYQTGPTRGITGVVYQSIRAVTALTGTGIEAILSPLVPLLGARRSPPGREAALAAMNGVMGDHLAATRNPLAISMCLRRHGKPLNLHRRAGISGKIVILAHGLCLGDLQWTRHGHNHGAALARDLGYTPLYLNYNSGLHISTNGRAFAALLEDVLAQWPVALEDLVMIGHSMGGMLLRSAFHSATEAGFDWPRRLRKIVFLGTPHHGAPLERLGAWVNSLLSVSPYTAALAGLGRIRSAGITDLRYGNLLDDDWAGRDRFRLSPDPRLPVPLPETVRCYAIAAAAGKSRAIGALLGDGLVPIDSALGRHPDPLRTLQLPKCRQWVAHGISHFDLLSSPEVYTRIRQWLAG